MSLLPIALRRGRTPLQRRLGHGRGWTGLAVALGLVLLAAQVAGAADVPPVTVRLDVIPHTLAADTAPKGWRYFSFNPLIGLPPGSSFRFVGAEAPGGPYIRLSSQGDSSYGVGAKHTFRLSEHPVLQWQWRVTRLPVGGDARVRARDDQAGSVCVAVNPGWISPDAVLCYLWENRGPLGATGTGFNSDAHKWMILRAADRDRVGAWYTERRDLDADFRQVFGRLPAGPVVVSLTIDTNDTDSSAEAFYRRLEVDLAPSKPGR